MKTTKGNINRKTKKYFVPPNPPKEKSTFNKVQTIGALKRMNEMLFLQSNCRG